MAILKKQLEEREKQLAAEQEDASAAKNRLRELSKVRRTSVSLLNKAADSARFLPQHIAWSIAMLAALSDSYTHYIRKQNCWMAENPSWLGLKVAAEEKAMLLPKLKGLIL